MRAFVTAMARLIVLVTLAGLGLWAAPFLFDLFFELMDYLYRRGVNGHWL